MIYAKKDAYSNTEFFLKYSVYPKSQDMSPRFSNNGGIEGHKNGGQAPAVRKVYMNNWIILIRSCLL